MNNLEFRGSIFGVLAIGVLVMVLIVSIFAPGYSTGTPLTNEQIITLTKECKLAGMKTRELHHGYGQAITGVQCSDA